MTNVIFFGLLSAGLVLFALFFLVDQRKLWKHKLLQGMLGVEEWRNRLNGLTDRVVALGGDELLSRAASNSNDPVLSRFSGQTLTLYKQIKSNYVALSYAYNCGARAVQQAEAMFKPRGALKLVTVRRVTELAEQGLKIKEINPTKYTSLQPPPRYSPSPPLYRLDYIFSVCDRLNQEVLGAVKTITDAPAKVNARLAAADKNLAAVAAQYDSLLTTGVTYLPYENSQKVITQLRFKVSSNIECDPLGALQVCTDLDRNIQSLAQELDSARKLQVSVAGGEQQLAAKRQRIEQVRATRIACPWSDTAGENDCWTLAAPGSNPDGQLAQSSTLLAQAKQSLATGQLSTVVGEQKQAMAALDQAEKMISALFSAKAAVDEQVPQVRAELATIHSQLVGITGGEKTHEMALLVEQTCKAVESRIAEVHSLYCKQLFPEALILLTGSAGNEYGMPIAKLLAQAKELVRLLQQAAKVASTLTPPKA